VFFAWWSRRRVTTARAAWAAAGIGTTMAVAVTFADMSLVATRFESTFSEGFSGRFSIWRQTWPVVRDFWPVGSGAGTYQVVMIPYQTMSRFFYISHADNEMLQILAEGGLILALPVVVALVSGVGLVVTRMRADRTPIFWLRLGAVAGLVAIAVQNMVEMTLRVPANAVLFTVLAAVALHEGSQHEKNAAEIRSE
jgi:O-antigen ligase